MSFGLSIAPIGCSPLSSFIVRRSTGSDVDPPPIGGLQVIVAGIDRSKFVDLFSFEVSEELNGRNLCAFTLNDQRNTFRIELSSEVLCRIDERTVFAGLVDQVEDFIPDNTRLLTSRIRCVDFNSFADRHLVVGRFKLNPVTSQPYKVGELVRDVINLYSGAEGERLSDDGVIGLIIVSAEGSRPIQKGPEIGTVNSNYLTASDLFDKLADLVSYWWNIDYRKVMNFVDRESNRSPFVLNEEVDAEFRDVTVERTLSRYRNEQIIRGGKGQETLAAETKSGNGTSTSFDLNFPVADEPPIIKNPGGVVQTVGIRGKDSGKDWFYEVGSERITQDPDATPLTTSESIVVGPYEGLIPIIIRNRAESEIELRAQLEGDTSGIYSEVETDETIDDVSIAQDRAAGLISRFGVPLTRITFTSPKQSFQIGQLIEVSLPEHGILNQDYLCSAIRLSFNGYDGQTQIFTRKATILSGDQVGGWGDYFRRLAEKGERFTIDEDTRVDDLRDFIEPVRITDVLSTSEPLKAYLNDKRSWLTVSSWWIGGTRQGGSPAEAWGPRLAPPGEIEVHPGEGTA